MCLFYFKFFAKDILSSAMLVSGSKDSNISISFPADLFSFVSMIV